MKEIYSWDVAEELQNGKRVYAIFKIENVVVMKKAEDLTMKEWVEHDCGRGMTFLKEKDYE